MNREEAIKILKEHHDHWMRLLKEGICTEEEGENAIEALDMAIKALDQEPCGDAIDRSKAIMIASGYCHPANVAKELAKLPPVTPQPKIGHWEWVQYDYNPKLGNWHCSECRCVVVECVGKEEKGGIPLYKYCPQCGAKMEVSE